MKKFLFKHSIGVVVGEEELVELLRLVHLEPQTNSQINAPVSQQTTIRLIQEVMRLRTQVKRLIDTAQEALP